MGDADRDFIHEPLHFLVRKRNSSGICQECNPALPRMRMDSRKRAADGMARGQPVFRAAGSGTGIAHSIQCTATVSKRRSNRLRDWGTLPVGYLRSPCSRRPSASKTRRTTWSEGVDAGIKELLNGTKTEDRRVH